MVRISGQDKYQTLDNMIREIAVKHGFEVYCDGWARKTYEIYAPIETRRKLLVARIESLAVSSGRIEYFDDRALEMCQELGERFETEFEIPEAVLEKKTSPR